MTSLHRKTARSLTPEMRRRLRAIVASAATGVIIYLLVVHVLLPGVQARLTPAQIKWLGEAFANHLPIVLGVIFVLAAVLATPVLCIFRLVYGPLVRQRAGGRDSSNL